MNTTEAHEGAVPKLDVLFVLPHLGPGGAQKVAALVASTYASRGMRVGMATLFPSPPDAHSVHSAVTRFQIEIPPFAVSKFAQYVLHEVLDDATTVNPWLAKFLGLTGAFAVDFVTQMRLMFLCLKQTLLRSTRYLYLYHKSPSQRLCINTETDNAEFIAIRTWQTYAHAQLALETAQVKNARSAGRIFFVNFGRVWRICTFGVHSLRAPVAARIRKLLASSRRAGGTVPDTRTRMLPSLLGGMQKRRVEALRGCFQNTQPTQIVSLLGATNIVTILAADELPCRVIVSERNDPALQRLNEPWESLRPLTYPKADIVTANTDGALKTLSTFVPAHKLRVVPNPLEVPGPPEDAIRLDRFLCVARLVPQKGIDLLVQAFAEVAPELPGWELHLVGDGPLRADLESQSEKSGLADRIIFHGFSKTPFEHYYRAKIFVLPSRFEGLPNSMLEAMGSGLPVIVSDSSPGPLEYVVHEQTGLVFRSGDVSSLAASMCRLARRPKTAAAMAVRAEQRIVSLGTSNALMVWDSILAGAPLPFESADALAPSPS